MKLTLVIRGCCEDRWQRDKFPGIPPQCDQGLTQRKVSGQNLILLEPFRDRVETDLARNPAQGCKGEFQACHVGSSHSDAARGRRQSVVAPAAPRCPYIVLAVGNAVENERLVRIITLYERIGLDEAAFDINQYEACTAVRSA